MKKVLFLSMVLSFVLAGFVFGADTFTVKSLTGRVDQQGPSGQWVAVSVGDTLSSTTTVKLELNAILVVRNGDQETTIRAARQGTLESLLGAGGGRISVGGNVTNSNVAAGSQGASNISTSASRASEVNDLDWAE